MADHSSHAEAALEVIAPDGSRENHDLTLGPFNIGRGGVGDNTITAFRWAHLSQLRNHYARGRRLPFARPRQPLWRVCEWRLRSHRHLLRDGDTITFGIEDSYRIVFHGASTPAASS